MSDVRDGAVGESNFDESGKERPASGAFFIFISEYRDDCHLGQSCEGEW